MLGTYSALLREHTLEWTQDAPKGLYRDRAVRVYVTIVADTLSLDVEEQGKRMATALEQLAQMESPLHHVDGAAWEREIRQDRQLPDRSGDNVEDFAWVAGLALLDPLSTPKGATQTGS